MISTMTITSRDSKVPSVMPSLSSLLNFPIDTVTMHSQDIKFIFELYEVDEEMREIEEAAITDFWKFEAMD